MRIHGKDVLLGSETPSIVDMTPVYSSATYQTNLENLQDKFADLTKHYYQHLPKSPETSQILQAQRRLLTASQNLRHLTDLALEQELSESQPKIGLLRRLFKRN